MINPDWKSKANAINFMTQSEGEWKTVGELQSINLEPVEPSEFALTTGGTITLGDVTITDLGKMLFGLFNNLESVDITVRKTRTKAGAKPLRSHKKRLVKKWRKKNILTDSETTYKNCTITGGDFK